MQKHDLHHVANRDLVRNLESLLASERALVSEVLAHVAEVDARKLYLPAGYPSMYTYCVQGLRLSEDAAYKRIHVARAARRFSVIFEALAAGRAHLTGVGLLVPFLSPDNVDDLLGATAHKSRRDIEALLAARFPSSEMLPMVEALSAPAARGACQLAPAQVGTAGVFQNRGPSSPPGVPVSPPPAARAVPQSSVAPIAHQRYALHLTMGRDTQRKLEYARELLSHRLPSADLIALLELALDALITQLEKRKFAATDRPREDARPASANARHIPASVKREVWKRDGGQCTFVSDAGQRCPSRTFLEFDHAVEVARGGQPTAEGVRLRCRAHNQYTAERTFGAAFMQSRREAARRSDAEGAPPTE